MKTERFLAAQLIGAWCDESWVYHQDDGIRYRSPIDSLDTLFRLLNETGDKEDAYAEWCLITICQKVHVMTPGQVARLRFHPCKGSSLTFAMEDDWLYIRHVYQDGLQQIIRRRVDWDENDREQCFVPEQGILPVTKEGSTPIVVR
jgi:hypothetical protein